jgi:hypothetical protein
MARFSLRNLPRDNTEPRQFYGKLLKELGGAHGLEIELAELQTRVHNLRALTAMGQASP